MVGKWYENQEVEKWISNEVNGEKYQQVLKILDDEMMMNLAACCTAAYEGYQSDLFRLRIKQILASPEEREDAAMFLVYHQNTETKETIKLPQSQPLNSQFLKKVKVKKEKIMNEQQKVEKPLTDKQVEFAQVNKERVLQEVEEFKQYLQKQENPQWWLKRRFFSFAANSFNKYKRDSFQAQRQQENVEQKASISDHVPTMNTQNSGQRI